MEPDELELLHRLRASSTPERWAAILALAQYMVEQPAQRLGQAVVNALRPPVQEGYVIRFDDGSYNSGSGFQVALQEADTFPTHEAAQKVVEGLYGVEAIQDVRTLDMPQPALFYLPDGEASALAVSRHSSAS